MTNTDPLSPYDAVLLCSYGGPDGPAAVLPFMRNATKGRGVPDERLEEVAVHYRAYNGVSPIIARNNELVEALQNTLSSRGSTRRVYLANRNWHPFFKETLRRMIHAGHRRILMLPTAAFASYSGCRQYREDVWQARQDLIEEGVVGARDLQVERAPLYYDQPGLVETNAQSVAAAWKELLDQGVQNPRLLLVTHSIPNGMNAASGLPGHNYVEQHVEHINALLTHLEFEPKWELVYCSRSGPAFVPWLEPDVNDAITTCANSGVDGVCVAPIGFVQDHMEVVHDLDTEAAQTAQEHGLAFTRAATAGTQPLFVETLAQVLEVRAAHARSGMDPRLTGHSWHDADVDACCVERPGAAIPHAISQEITKEETMTTGHPHGHAGSHPGGHPGGHPHEAHPTGHQAGPADPRDHKVSADEVNAKDHYFLFTALADMREYDAENATELAKEVEDAIAAHDVTVRGFYNVEGFRADADLMVWFYADEAEKIQKAYRALLDSQLGQSLEPVWNNFAAHIPAEFDAAHLPAAIDGSAPREWCAVYPFVRSLDWYYLNPNKRRAILREHGMNGRDFLDVKISTLASFALGDYEWMITLEADSLDRVMGVLRKQREVEARLYTRIDTPFYTGRRMELKDWIAR
ncbi:hydrogen peroxide-dependent heme synthase [Gleimia hominis]|uniref:hydrogen peroxide-dependent heme synthase n=1 Tax=Gleimia hominis TaxID=595468 RepID=UPI000C8008D4|nr:hydrogen peroxide-dependent heme synthase [Gleimia hominis]WIK64089.1 ferrochelatase [Gleimia hominis]